MAAEAKTALTGGSVEKKYTSLQEEKYVRDLV